MRGAAMSKEVKPCPFCGSKAGIFKDDKNSDNIRYGVMCTGIDCAFWGWFESAEEAARSWNRRVSNDEGQDN